jgi:hypothetical protein
MNRTRWKAIPVLVVATTALLGACDDDADDDVAGETTVAEADLLDDATFVEQADALCVANNDAIGGVLGPLFGDGEPTPDAMDDALAQIVAQSRGLADDLDALAAPEAISDDVDAMVAALEAGTDEAEAQSGPEFFGTDDDPWAAAGAIAADLGLDACAGEG